MSAKRAGLALLVGTILVTGGARWWQWRDAEMIRHLRDDPGGEKAAKTMVLELPSGKVVTVNYLRDGNTVYAAADFPWWRELRGGGGRVSVMIRGERLHGGITAVEDDADLRDRVFDRLRPTAPRYFGTLLVIELD